jgi:tungstate transport system substrate-binding protein
MKTIRLCSIAVILTAVVSTTIISCKKEQGDILNMATTTSTDNTGLLDYLKPTIFSDTGINLHWVAVGTGRALELGKNCDVDILLVHAPAAEKKYINAGYGVDRRKVMYNDFIIIGPKNDPAGIKGKSASGALGTIASKKAIFTSRGDDSGTHKMELFLWKEAGVISPDKQAWYIQTGQGMINTINIANERNGYTLTDRATYIKYSANLKNNPPLIVLVEGDGALKNQYSIITVNAVKCPKTKTLLAKKFTDWIVSPKAQKLLGDYKLLGKQLYIPNAD